MNKPTVFALGFASAFALPLCNAFLQGLYMGVDQAKEEQMQKKMTSSILDYSGLN